MTCGFDDVVTFVDVLIVVGGLTELVLVLVVFFVVDVEVVDMEVLVVRVERVLLVGGSTIMTVSTVRVMVIVLCAACRRYQMLFVEGFERCLRRDLRVPAMS